VRELGPANLEGTEPACVCVEVQDGPEAGAELWVARFVVVCA
jgi:hypothetical protein